MRLIGAWWLMYVGHRNHRSLHDMLASWDGQWMLALARHGYSGVPTTLTDAHGRHTADTAYAFFPGYPGVVHAVSFLGVSTYAAAIVTSLVCGGVATVAAYRIGRWCAACRWPGDDDRADQAGVLMAVLFAATPMSVVLSMAYTEAIYCALAGWALWMVLEKRWVATGLLTTAAGLTRATAVALIAVVVVAAYLDRRGSGWRAWAGIVLAPLGWLAWMAVVAARTGSPLGWFQVQANGWDTGVDFGLATLRYLRDTFATNQTAGDVFTAGVIVATLVLIVLNFATRLPWPVALYGTLAAGTVLLSTGLMNSRVRLLLPAFVLLTPVALALAQRSRMTQVTVAAATTLVSTWFGAYMLGIYPYAI